MINRNVLKQDYTLFACTVQIFFDGIFFLQAIVEAIFS